MTKKILYQTILIVLFGSAIYSQGVVSIESKYFNIDTSQRLIVINKNVDSLNLSFPELKIGILAKATTYTFEESIQELEIGSLYKVLDEKEQAHRLYFSELPIINITTANEIVDEPRVLANFALCEHSGNYTTSYIGVEHRGGWTQTLPKKSFRIEFWSDADGENKTDFCLLGLRCDDDWNLQAMCNEPMRIRSKLGYDLWRKIDTLSYQNDEPTAINGVRQEYVELFVNETYRGLYTLSERNDRKQLRLKKYDDVTRGELYKGIGWGASTFAALPQFNNQSNIWSGFEFIYPDEEIDWTNIYEFVDFVINEDWTPFIDNYRDQFDLDNAVNYFIFLNLLRATDNAGKNTFIAKYDTDEPYFYIPWDLDGSFGIIWNGSVENITDDILTNGLYEKLLLDNSSDGFLARLENKWKDLRENTITTDNLIENFNSEINYLRTNKVYERELATWQGCETFGSNNEYTFDWIRARIDYLDEVFNNPELLTATQENILSEVLLKLSPNPASNTLSYEATINNHILESVVVVNSLGIPVLNFYTDNNLGQIDVSALSPGIYYVSAEFRNGVRKVEKFLVAR